MSQVIVFGENGHRHEADFSAAEIKEGSCATQCSESPAQGTVDLPEMVGDFCGDGLPDLCSRSIINRACEGSVHPGSGPEPRTSAGGKLSARRSEKRE